MANKKLIIVLGTLVLIFALIGVIFVVSQIVSSDKNSNNPSGSSSTTTTTTTGEHQMTTPTDQISNDDFANNPLSSWVQGCTNDDKVMMENAPMNPADFSHIIPLGLVAGAHVTPIDHLYFSPKNFRSPRDAYPVFAMADGYIVEISVRRHNTDSGSTRAAEYRIIMQHSCQTVSYFDLVTSLDQTILDQVPQLQTSDYFSDIKIPITAGQIIGRIGGQTLDTAVYNMNLTLPGFITPEMYIGEPWKIHTDDFFSYFSEPLLSQLLDKNLRTDEPRSGKIDTDLAGKLQGNWFTEGTNGYSGIEGVGVGNDGHGYWDGHLHIGHDNIKPTEIWVSIGDYGGNGPKHFYVKGNSPDPAEVSVESGLVKYELIQPQIFNSKTEVINYRRNEGQVLGVILLQVIDGERLKAEIFPGQTGININGFSSNATIYER